MPSWGKVLNAILRGPGFTHRLCRAQLRKVTNQSWVQKGGLTCKAGDTRPKTTDQGGSLGSLVFPHQLSPAVHLPLNLIPDRDVLKFAPPETPHSQLLWLRTWWPQLPTIRRGPQPRTFREMFSLHASSLIQMTMASKLSITILLFAQIKHILSFLMPHSN